jgi:hypothetical protein
VKKILTEEQKAKMVSMLGVEMAGVLERANCGLVSIVHINDPTKDANVENALAAGVNLIVALTEDILDPNTNSSLGDPAEAVQ